MARKKPLHDGMREVRREFGKDVVHPILRQERQEVFSAIKNYAMGQ